MKNDDHIHYEEQYHAMDRKEHRKERKHITSRDRSKYKKSDQDQLKKQAVVTDWENVPKGLVLRINPEGIIVSCDGKIISCQLKGQLKQEKKQIKNLVAVGDFVRVLPKNTHEGIIVHIDPRYSILSRADNLSRKKEQLIAVNIDLVLITCSVVSPPLKLPLIDRYIIAAKKGNLTPIIIVNKIDLFEQPPSNVSPEDLEEEKQLYHEFLNIYQNLGIPIFPISIKQGVGIEALLEIMKNKQSVFSGQSGVGKSSLINSILGENLATGLIVGKTSKGSHTTSYSQLFPLPSGGFCIDTPGIKSFGIWNLEKEEIQNYFSEILLYSKKCKFPDCSHMQEPECAVSKALEKGKISPMRFSSYCTLIQDCLEKHQNR